jgi:hypothetical protein
VEIVAPLHSDPVLDTRVRPAGAALLWHGPDRWEVFTLAPGVATKVAAMKGDCPYWLKSYGYSNGKRSATILSLSEIGVELGLFPWSDSAIGPVRRIEDWPGRYIAAASQLNAEDEIYGAVVLLRDAELGLVSWKLDAKSGFEQKPWKAIRSTSEISIRQVRVSVSREGVSTVLLRDAGDRWHVWNGASIMPISVSAAPMEIAYFGRSEPLMIYAEPRIGFQLCPLF